jgi:DNA-binding MarR family transcriptional regulator
MANDEMPPANDSETESDSAAPIFAPLELAKLAAAGSRFFNGLAEIEIFADGELDLTDWVALSMIAETENVMTSQLLRAMGISRERAGDLASSFQSAGLISVTPHARDPRAQILSITDLGQEKLDRVNDQLQLLLTQTLGPRERLVPNTARSLILLLKLLSPGKAAEAAET